MKRTPKRVRKMNKKIFRQYDSPWVSLPYPTKSSPFGGNGCGACSVLHCIIERTKYKKYTPKSIIAYMKQFAVPGQGTKWAGIYEALKHYGMKNVKWFGVSDPIESVFKELNYGKRIGVILFGSDIGPDGTVWTADGHYIAFTAYKVKNGKHWFYLKDSGPRHHDGWYCYEQSMRGDVRQVWTCTVPAEKKKTKVKATAKTGGKTLKSWKKCLEKWKKYYLTHGYFYNSNPKKRGGKSINCVGFCLRSLYHFGEIPKSAIYAYTKRGRLVGPGADIIRKKCEVIEGIDMPFYKAVKKGLVKPGDIIGYTKTLKGKWAAHTEIWKGDCEHDGKMTHKFYNWGPNFRKTNGVEYRPMNYKREVGCVIRIKNLKR